MQHNDIPLGDIKDKKYDPLMIEALKYEFVGIKTEYIANQISYQLGKEIQVQGKEEYLFPCPCCSYRTLKSHGEYDICPICYWEDDGNDEAGLSVYSIPNHMTLAEAKEKFKKLLDSDAKENNDYVNLLIRYNKA